MRYKLTYDCLILDLQINIVYAGLKDKLVFNVNEGI